MIRVSRRIAVLTLIATLLIEAITCLLRFGLRLQSTRDTASMARFTFGLRIHHGYLGVCFVVAGLFLRASRWKDVLVIVGGALALSDLIHHFLVLWPITGSPQFDWLYR
jgi:hypothetical protein